MNPIDISTMPQNPAAEDVANEIDNTTITPAQEQQSGVGPTDFNEDGAPILEAAEDPTVDADQDGQ